MLNMMNFTAVFVKKEQVMSRLTHGTDRSGVVKYAVLFMVKLLKNGMNEKVEEDASEGDMEGKNNGDFVL